eukprot:jgi/Mesvir1/17361/Mv08671-RA.1
MTLPGDGWKPEPPKGILGEEYDKDGNVVVNVDTCLAYGIGSALSGGIMGGIWGLGSGGFRTKSLKGGLTEAGSSAKTFALMGGLYSGVLCYSRKLRGSEDALNSGIAGCVTGMALGWGGGPGSAIQSCVGFGLFSWVLDYMSPSPAIAAVGERGAGRSHSQMGATGRLRGSSQRDGSIRFVIKRRSTGDRECKSSACMFPPVSALTSLVIPLSAMLQGLPSGFRLPASQSALRDGVSSLPIATRGGEAGTGL